MAVLESDWLIRQRLEFESVKFESPSLPSEARAHRTTFVAIQFESTCRKSSTLRKLWFTNIVQLIHKLF